MKYTTNITINKPLNEVVELFDNEENTLKWIEGLKSIEHISGEKGEVGAVSNLTIEMGKRKMEMKETIVAKKLPHLFGFKYDTKQMTNVNTFHFKEENGKTIQTTDTEITMHTFGMKVMGALMKGMFKKQTMKYSQAFKEFAENN